jgi:hypothetical protein
MKGDSNFQRRSHAEFIDSREVVVPQTVGRFETENTVERWKIRSRENNIIQITGRRSF